MRRVGKSKCKAFVNEATHTQMLTAILTTRQGTLFGISSSKCKRKGSGADSSSHLWADFRASYISNLFQCTLTPPLSFISVLQHHLPALTTWKGDQEPTQGDTSAFGPAYSAQLRYLLFKHLVYKTLLAQAISEANTAGAPHQNTLS